MSRSRGQSLRAFGSVCTKPPLVDSGFKPVLSEVNAGAAVASGTLLPVRPGRGVIWPGCFLQPDAARVRKRPKTNSLVKSVSFMFMFCGSGYRAQLGCDCELLPEVRETSLTCLVGASRRDRT